MFKCCCCGTESEYPENQDWSIILVDSKECFVSLGDCLEGLKYTNPTVVNSIIKTGIFDSDIFDGDYKVICEVCYGIKDIIE